jgi:Prokaryotic E2 family D
MEPGNVEHAGGLDGRAHQGKRRKKKGEERPDALLHYLIEHEEFDVALLFTRGMYILYCRTGRELIPKGLSPETLRAAFVGEPVDSGWLSPDVKRCGSGPTGPFAVKFIPPGKHTLRLSTGDPSKPLVVSVPLPGLVFAGVNTSLGGTQATYYVWAIQEEEFDPTAALFQVPLTNVYDDGRICFGENHPPKAARETIDRAWRLFIDSLFTGEMAGGKSRQHPQDVRSYLIALNEADRYPVEDLERFERQSGFYPPSPRVKTVSDAVEKYILMEEKWQH